jgi:hypothetical protein
MRLRVKRMRRMRRLGWLDDTRSTGLIILKSSLLWENIRRSGSSLPNTAMSSNRGTCTPALKHATPPEDQKE